MVQSVSIGVCVRLQEAITVCTDWMFEIQMALLMLQTMGKTIPSLEIEQTLFLCHGSE